MGLYETEVKKRNVRTAVEELFSGVALFGRKSGDEARFCLNRCEILYILIFHAEYGSLLNAVLVRVLWLAQSFQRRGPGIEV